MSKLKKSVSAFLALIMLVGVIAAAPITASAATYTCGVGKTKQLSDTNFWGDGSTTTKTWSSSNTSIARIQSQSGSTCQVYGVSPGKVTITCYTVAQKWVGDAKYGYLDVNTTTKYYDLEVVAVDGGSSGNTSSVSAYDKLKNYLLSKGKKQTLYNGDVMYDVNWTKSGYTYHINYVNGESEIFFGCSYQDGSTLVNFALYVSSGSTANCIVNYDIVPQVSVKFNKSDYVKGKSLNFKVDYSGSGSISDKDAIKKSNTLFGKAFSAFNTYINSNAGVTMKKLGFTNCDKTVKKANTITVKASAKSVKYSKLKKKAITVKPLTVKKAKGKVTYKKISGNKKITVNSNTGKFKIKKGLKKGKYTVKVKITAAGNSSYKSKKVTKKVTIKVK